MMSVERESRRRFLWNFFMVGFSGITAALSTFIAGCRCAVESPRLSYPVKNSQTETPSAAHAIFEPAYLKLHKSGELKRRGEELWRSMEECRLCPRECGAKRLKGERGFCQASAQLEVASYNPHFGEEHSLVGEGGSGTIFFTNCSLRCVFCINQSGRRGEGRKH